MRLAGGGDELATAHRAPGMLRPGGGGSVAVLRELPSFGHGGHDFGERFFCASSHVHAPNEKAGKRELVQQLENGLGGLLM